jgi:Reverse transcriptase (RNA-dependent DNA polymerase)
MGKGDRRLDGYDWEGCTVQDTATVLSIIRKRGERGLPLRNAYRLLYNPNLYLTAYGKLYRNKGAMTRGTTAETVDGMSRRKIDAIIEAVRHERYRWTPVRRVYIEKRNSTKKRPLGLPTWSDKLLQEVIRLVLDAYYEPQFDQRSHGFRPGRGCHTALAEVQRIWTGTKWFVEGDIARCFDHAPGYPFREPEWLSCCARARSSSTAAASSGTRYSRVAGSFDIGMRPLWMRS